ncbi:MAG: VCBS repeat-containing protein, partial [Candidatus Hydrogenedentes bacterium]|nr:VCBS repeat-containing protein [Candidatus Hydrogenedentota bacterium]
DGDGMPIFHKPGLTSLRVGDINNDGLRDVVAVGWGSDTLVCLDGDPETLLKPPRISTVHGGPFSLVLVDLNHDKNLDVAVTLMATNEIAILRGDGKGGFAEVQRFASRGRLPHRLESADINQDGQEDLVVSHKDTDDSIVIFYGASDFLYPASQEIRLGSDREVLEHQISDITIGDFNQDGFPDIGAACFRSGKVITLTTDSSKNKTFLEFRQASYSFKGGQPRALCAADLNQDGKDDIAVALSGLNEVRLLLNRNK